MIDLISYRCSPWYNHIDHSFVSYYFIYLMAQSAPHWWGMFFTQQTSCLPHVFLIYSSWYIGIYTVDTLLYSLCFTNCIIPFLPLLSIHPWVFTWVLQPELLLKVITISDYFHHNNMRITGLREEFGPPEMFLRCLVVDSSIPLE